MVNFVQHLTGAKHFAMMEPTGNTDPDKRQLALDPDTCIFGSTTWTQLNQFLVLSHRSEEEIRDANKAYASHVMKNVVGGMRTNRLRNKEGYVIG